MCQTTNRVSFGVLEINPAAAKNNHNLHSEIPLTKSEAHVKFSDK